ncbi:hypothetical protein GA0070609_2238 [Micromonospora echinaurantiaca]|uniref:Uncharacterized protein n=1 Tax=Micromonospora echinaurantiaca TaxID=47857 RepID=A0A1C5HTZ4_9ACTN|nr:hypothetical protein [Micromonospora echinaurantiaca]SCG49484.1 hypothetical protein GA0070609_2238 [Micromonospora echinaurantiaca]
MLLIDWLSEAWTRARAVRVLDGGLDGGPLAERTVLAETHDPVRLARMRQLTTVGRFTGDVCRCLGGPTLALYDADDTLLGSATLHGHGSVSWERSRFADDIEVDEPEALTLFLAEGGVTGLLVDLLGPLVTTLGYDEAPDGPQFRPVGAPAVLADRQVPEVLRDELVDVAGSDAARLPDARVRRLAERLAGAEPDPVARAGALLNWLGRLPYPTEALWGEGVLVRRLLAALPDADIVTATASGTPVMVLGAVNWAAHQPDDCVVATAVARMMLR